MNQEILAQFTLLRYSGRDALQFIMANGAAREKEENGEAHTAAPLPGLAKLAELQEKHYDDEKTHHFGSYDPLCVGRCSETSSHERWCAHSQTACALAKNAVAAALQERIEVRVHRYGEALLALANATDPSEELEEASTAVEGDSAACSPNATNGALTNESLAPNGANNDGEDSEEDEEDEEIELYLLKHVGFTKEAAVAWLQRRYLRCCELMGVRASVVVSQRLSQCVQPCLGGTVGSFFAAQKTASPLSPVSERRFVVAPKAARTWMAFPETLVLLRAQCAIPYEVNPDLHGCGDIGKQPRHFVAVMGVLEGCRYTVVSLNLSNTGLTDREVRVLCLFCHAHLRRLKVLDISHNPGVTDKVAVRLKKLAASLPLLSRLSVRGTSLNPGPMRAIDRLLYRKVL